MSPRQRSAVQRIVEPPAGAAPPELQVDEVLGRPVIKDFRDEETKLRRPFKGYVRRRYKTDGRWVPAAVGAVQMNGRVKCNSECRTVRLCISSYGRLWSLAACVLA